MITILAKSQNSFKKHCVRAEHRTRIPRTAPFKVLIRRKDLMNFLMAMILFEKEKERNRTCKVPHFRNLMKERCLSCVATETLTKCKAPSTYIQLQIFYRLILYGFNKLSKGYKTRTHKAGTSLVLGGKRMSKHVPLFNGTQLSFIHKGGIPFSANKTTIGMMLTLQTQFAFVQQQGKCHSYCMLLVPASSSLSLSLSLFPIRNSRS